MNDKICIDKRVILLVLFSLPILGLFFLSGVINSQKVSTQSKASSENTFKSMPTVAVPSGTRAVCLSASTNTLYMTIDLFVKRSEDLLPQPLKVYFSNGSKVQYIGLVGYPFPTNMQKPFYTLKMNLLPGNSWAKFIGVQNGEESVLEAFAENCQVATHVNP